MSIRKKALLLIGILPSMLIGLGFVANNLVKSLKEGFIKDQVINTKTRFESQIMAQAETNLKQASVFVKLPEVIEAYRVAHQGNIDDENDPYSQKARDMIRLTLEDSLKGYTDVVNDKLNLHFHLSNASSLVRLNREKQIQRNSKWIDVTDSLATFRFMVLDVNKKSIAAKGIELGRAGFAVRGMLPIIDPENGQHLGSVEVISDFDEVFLPLLSSENDRIALLMNAEQLEITHKLKNNKRVSDSFIEVHDLGKGVQDLVLSDELLLPGKNGLSWSKWNDSIIGTFPISDYIGQQVGVVLFAPDATRSTLLVKKIRVYLFGGFGVFVAILGFTIVFFVEKSILARTKEMKNKIEDIVNDRANLDEMLKEGSDEFGQLSVSFNSLLGKITGFLHESERLSNYLLKLPSPVFMVDPGFVVTFSNIEASKLVGDDIKDRSFFDLCGIDDGCLSMSKEDATTVEISLTINSKKMPTRITGIPIMENGYYQGLLLFVVDLSEIYEVVDELKSAGELLSQSAESLDNSMQILGRDSTRMSDESAVVNDVSRSFSNSVVQLEQSSADVSTAFITTSSAVEELTASLSEVANNTAKGSQIANKLNQMTHTVEINMTKLVELISSIDKVTALIDHISSQTNLLALNATIEAASAGDSGKGFAVVSVEVKELANQTSAATKSIQKELDDIKSATKNVSNEVNEITKAVNNLAIISSSNAAAVEQQSATIVEISRTVASTSESAEYIAVEVKQAAIQASDISKRLGQMNNLIGNTTNGVLSNSMTINKLRESAEEINRLARKFSA